MENEDDFKENVFTNKLNVPINTTKIRVSYDTNNEKLQARIDSMISDMDDAK